MRFVKRHVFLLHLVWCTAVLGRSHLYNDRQSHKALDLSQGQMKALAVRSDTNHFNRVLNKILVPRIVGTPQHKEVANFIVDEMEKLGWEVERNKFKDTTPIFGELEFENIIAKLNPNADRFLVLACHYDSKYMREHNFVGATDSAVPCSMMLNLAETLKTELSSIKKRNDVSLAFIFFDGEEAFKHWGPKDSIYGARHLANNWHSAQFKTSKNAMATEIERIDVLVLLDLLGAPNPKIYNYFTETANWFSRLVNIEEDLGEMGMLRKPAVHSYEDTRYFVSRNVGSHIEDDHVPFYIRGVPILHVIPLPFPDVWHKPSDNINALDADTIENFNKIFRVFVAHI